MGFLKEKNGQWSFIRIASFYLMVLFTYLVIFSTKDLPVELYIAILFCALFPKAIQKKYENML